MSYLKARILNPQGNKLGGPSKISTSCLPTHDICQGVVLSNCDALSTHLFSLKNAHEKGNVEKIITSGRQSRKKR